MTPPFGTNILTASELANRWGMSKGTLENWRAAGKGPAFIKLGKGGCAKIVYRLKDVEAWELKMRRDVGR